MNLDSTKLLFRPLTLSDAETLFAWKNDPDTRRFSGNTNFVPWESHLEWVKGVILDPKGKILHIAEIDSQPVGLIRTAPRSDGTVEIHYAVAPECREQGIGRA